MKTKLYRFAIIALLILLAACSGIPVSQDYEPATNFSTLKTYHWDPSVLSNEKNIKGDPLLDARIHKAIDRKLAAMGYVLKPNTDTDFIVNYQTDMRQRLTSDGPTTSFSFGFGSFGNFGGIGIGTGSTIRDEDEATLIINILSSKDNSLLWRGTSSRYVYHYNKPEELTKIINEHVDAILDQFPPNKKASK
jgi:ABC-type glycerol-3-phosphate transport system substrate-binding protein